MIVLALAIAAWRAHGSGPSEGVDLGQSRDPTAIAVVQRVPATRIEERPDRPRHELPILKPQSEGLYAKGSVERAEQDARRRAAPPAGEIWLPAS
jgi:hypothetical protein